MEPMERDHWERLGNRDRPTWYLDPLVARQKGEANLELIRRWSAGVRPARVLKTDLFEEAFGEDQVLHGLFPEADLVCGIDEASSTAGAAARRFPELARGGSVMDVRRLGLRGDSFDLILSTSTLDHFDHGAEFQAALAELARVLRPGGLLILTLDNPANPLYLPLKWLSRTRAVPFPLGYTPGAPTLRTELHKAGLVIEAEDWLLHNPRGLSTLAFLALRRLPKPAADAAISALLALASRLGRLPTRRLTACFQAVAARKPRAALEGRGAGPLPRWVPL